MVLPVGTCTLTVPAAAASTSTSQHPCGASVDVEDHAPPPYTCWEYDSVSPAMVTMNGDRSATGYYTKKRYMLTPGGHPARGRHDLGRRHMGGGEDGVRHPDAPLRHA